MLAKASEISPHWEKFLTLMGIYAQAAELLGAQENIIEEIIFANRHIDEDLFSVRFEVNRLLE